MDEQLQYRINTISRLSIRLNSLVWWASPIASKNRFYQPFNDVFDEKKVQFIKLIPIYLYKLVRLIISTIVKCSYARFVKSNCNPSKVSKDILIIKSFLYPTQSLDNYVDSFFGDLPKYLPENFEVVYLLEPVNCHKLALSKSNQNIVSIFKIINPTDILWILYHLIANFFRIYKETFDDDLDRRIFHIHLLDHINPTTFFAMLYYTAGLRLGKWPHARTLLYTFENNPWEKMLLAGINKSAKHIKKIGYQHNVIPLASSNMFFGDEELSLSPKPDKILTTGPITANILKKYSAFNNQNIPTCALRYKDLYQLTPVVNKSKNLLIALEGVLQASSFLNHFGKQLDQLVDWNIIIRCHPALPFNQLKKSVTINFEKYSNVKISINKSLFEDLNSSFVVMYWGSTVGLEALMLSKPVINIQFTETNYDPLFELHSLKKTWVPSSPLILLLDYFYNMDPAIFNNEYNSARKYIINYLSPCTDENMTKFVSAL
ncbi:hypothetical protein [Bacteriovorax sp. Seq25_V]|uniref:hypothetical protein n=1 Tax=Bacteriovorax sp. Seq25_V TaxID=1201288 RepID=UPI000389E92B|nr:hypothetical protein [Bacteriovorax sp. Seq25_V]EQC43298.1 hypothetical protein M900_0044 [Bacteriovorax sp. Seq25_V]